MAGVVIEDLLGLGGAFATLCVFLAPLLFFLGGSNKKRKVSSLVSLVLLGCALGVFRVDVSQMQNTRVFDDLIGETVELRGVVDDEPNVREEYTNLVLKIRLSAEEDSRIRALVRVPTYPLFAYGDEVVVVGKLVKPKNFSGDQDQKVFDYRAYLAKDGIYYQMYYPKMVIVAHGQGNVIQDKLYAWKGWLLRNINRAIPEPEASLAAGITLGAKQSLGDEWLQKFRETGVAHIVVLSGYNIAIVLSIVSRLVIILPSTARLVASMLGIILFAVMVGGGATVVRATLMALVVILVRMSGREHDALRALTLVAGLMVLVNPMILLHDVSFQLSFTATLAIITFVPILERYVSFIVNPTFREVVVTTVATQVFVLPLLLYHMGTVSLIGFIANILIVPVVPIAMLCVALVAGFAGVPILGSVVTLGAYAILAYVIVMIETLARVPYASLSNIPFPLWVLMPTYVFLGIFITKNSSRGTMP